MWYEVKKFAKIEENFKPSFEFNEKLSKYEQTGVGVQCVTIYQASISEPLN